MTDKSAPPDFPTPSEILNAVEDAISRIKEVFQQQIETNSGFEAATQLGGDINWLKNTLNTTFEKVAKAIDKIEQTIAAQVETNSGFTAATQLGGDIKWLKNTLNDVGTYVNAVKSVGGVSYDQIAALNLMQYVPTGDAAAARAALTQGVADLVKALGPVAEHAPVPSAVAQRALGHTADLLGKLPDFVMERLAPAVEMVSFSALAGAIDKLAGLLGGAPGYDKDTVAAVAATATAIRAGCAWVVAVFPVTFSISVGAGLSLFSLSAAIFGSIGLLCDAVLAILAGVVIAQSGDTAALLRA